MGSVTYSPLPHRWRASWALVVCNLHIPTASLSLRTVTEEINHAGDTPQARALLIGFCLQYTFQRPRNSFLLIIKITITFKRYCGGWRVWHVCGSADLFKGCLLLFFLVGQMPSPFRGPILKDNTAFLFLVAGILHLLCHAASCISYLGPEQG